MRKTKVLMVIGVLLGQCTAAQDTLSVHDTVAVGGTALPATYTEKVFMPTNDPAETGIWTHEDSLRFIPAHGIYGDWNTQMIFGTNNERHNDTSELVLGYAPCDHFIPTCGRITSKFGMRRGRPHKGVDLKVKTGDPIRAAFDGMVRISRYSRSFGHFVVIRHSNGLESLYAHLSKRLVQPGDMVNAGEVIGKGGNTGRSSGAHLHFELRYLGHAIDPANVFDLKEGELLTNKLLMYRGRLLDPGATVAKKHSKKTAPSATVHVVRKGDTLYGLGRRYGVSVSELCRMNGIRQSSTLRIGQRIKLATL